MGRTMGWQARRSVLVCTLRRACSIALQCVRTLTDIQIQTNVLASRISTWRRPTERVKSEHSPVIQRQLVEWHFTSFMAEP